MSILIFVHEVNNRVKYAFDLIFKQILKTPFSLTSDKDEYLNYSGAKFVYRKSPLDKGLFFYSADLLFEKNLKFQNLQVDVWNSHHIFFLNENYGALPFDPFAASFYLVSRYEEYVTKHKDGHNRFDPNYSIAKRNNFLQEPVVNHYAELVKNTILESYPNVFFPERKYSFQPTIDIDNAYAYKYKNPIRVLPSLVKSLVKFKFGDFSGKLKVILGGKKDPYDTYEKQNEIHEKYQLNPIYFFLLGNRSKFDKNLPHTNIHLRTLIKMFGDKYQLGMHPSYSSNRKKYLFDIEKKRLEDISNKEITKSRQHFLKLTLPDTYQNLIEKGIKEDYSMGYSKITGFRAGICSPFYFYDLKKEEQTSLLVHPFCVMDSTLKFYMKVRSSEVLYTIKPLIEKVKQAKGEFVMIFHNESLGTHKMWRNWSEVYETVVRAAKAR